MRDQVIREGAWWGASPERRQKCADRFPGRQRPDTYSLRFAVAPIHFLTLEFARFARRPLEVAMSDRRSALLHCLGLALVAVPMLANAQPGRGGGAQALRTIEDRTASMRKLDGFFPLYWDSAGGQLFMEIPRLNTEVLHVMGLGAGLGSNDIGLDRGGLMGSRIVSFERS